MSTATVAPPAQPKPAKIPSLNPYLAPQAMCPTCRALLEPMPGKNRDGSPSVLYSCETCGYTLAANAQHILGECVPTSKVGQKGWPTIIEQK